MVQTKILGQRSDMHSKFGAQVDFVVVFLIEVAAFRIGRLKQKTIQVTGYRFQDIRIPRISRYSDFGLRIFKHKDFCISAIINNAGGIIDGYRPPVQGIIPRNTPLIHAYALEIVHADWVDSERERVEPPTKGIHDVFNQS